MVIVLFNTVGLQFLRFLLEHVYMRPKWIQTGLKSQTALKCRSVYMAIYMEISLQLSKQ